MRNDDDLLYILLAANKNGLASIHRFLSEHLVNKKPFLGPVDGSTFFENPADGFVIYPLGTHPFEDLAENERIGILPWEVNKLHSVN